MLFELMNNMKYAKKEIAKFGWGWSPTDGEQGHFCEILSKLCFETKIKQKTPPYLGWSMKCQQT